ncbi:hypothetical protein Pint_25940 [Pistacia integerrima]|uniref:Uncharacterized protein n=2 Tax=Pistacia integerrima TaxID=434235 RepID=A0ACC0YGK8_9ROSI|nr:hypothetical protein Pint_25939 [Pistacia integerrima]KAJ0035272.1 hypothetical protein Pint_25940 [Pistacia integerrima]
MNGCGVWPAAPSLRFQVFYSDLQFLSFNVSSSSTPSAASTSVEEFPPTISHFPVSPPGWSSRTTVDDSFKIHPFPTPSLTNTNTIPGMISIRIQQLCVPIQDGEFHRRTKTKICNLIGFICFIYSILVCPHQNLRPLGGNVPAIAWQACVANLDHFGCFHPLHPRLFCSIQELNIYIVGNFDGESKNKYSFRGDEFQLPQQ